MVKKKIIVKGNKLTPKQELFCQYYATNEEFFGNGVKSYLEAYGLKSEEGKSISYDTAKANAYKLLTKSYITTRINELFQAHGLNDTFVDKQLEKLIIQDADFKTKINAIKEYNALKQRVVKKAEVKVQKAADFFNEICDTDRDQKKIKR